jgi:hypothetical protein
MRRCCVVRAATRREQFVVTPKGFRTPERRIKSQSDLDAFLRSKEMAQFERWLRSINELVVGKKLTDPIESSPVRHSCRRCFFFSQRF